MDSGSVCSPSGPWWWAECVEQQLGGTGTRRGAQRGPAMMISTSHGGRSYSQSIWQPICQSLTPTFFLHATPQKAQPVAGGSAHLLSRAGPGGDLSAQHLGVGWLGASHRQRVSRRPCVFAFLIPEALEFVNPGTGARAVGGSSSQPLSFLGGPQELSAPSGPQFTSL